MQQKQVDRLARQLQKAERKKEELQRQLVDTEVTCKQALAT